jgi:hypothetical protein
MLPHLLVVVAVLLAVSCIAAAVLVPEPRPEDGEY